MEMKYRFLKKNVKRYAIVFELASLDGLMDVGKCRGKIRLLFIKTRFN